MENLDLLIKQDQTFELIYELIYKSCIKIGCLLIELTQHQNASLITNEINLLCIRNHTAFNINQLAFERAKMFRSGLDAHVIHDENSLIIQRTPILDDLGILIDGQTTLILEIEKLKDALNSV